MTIKEWQQELHDGARQRGWYSGELGDKTKVRIASLLCLIHSEVSEALEDLRNDQMIAYKIGEYKVAGFPTELADIVIRVLDMAEWLGIDMEKEIAAKNKYNKERGYRHGNKAL
jgi:NTP pyrophosphatase (non-canonical NTP hydrolase)